MEKTREHFMVTCLFEEIDKYPRKFNEKSTQFIKDLNTRFFDNPEYKLSEAQLKWLEDIWNK